MPSKFWNDHKDIKFKKAYFNKYRNIWHHGDYAQITNNDGLIISGRSDTTLNPFANSFTRFSGTLPAALALLCLSIPFLTASPTLPNNPFFDVGFVG